MASVAARARQSRAGRIGPGTRLLDIGRVDWQTRDVAGFHHVELWVADFEEARAEWGWLLSRLDFALDGEWPNGQTWSAGGAYLTLTTSPNVTTPVHDRRRVGVNHLAFKAGTESAVDAVMTDAPAHG